MSLGKRGTLIDSTQLEKKVEQENADDSEGEVPMLVDA